MLLNRPEMVAMWLAMGKIAVSSALINTNSTGKALTHAVEVATKDTKQKYLIVDNDLRKAIKEDVDRLEQSNIKILFWDDLKPLIEKQSTERPSKEHRQDTLERDPFLYIYTSGTTGEFSACLSFLDKNYFDRHMYPQVCQKLRRSHTLDSLLVQYLSLPCVT
jgi:acyl-CoA synthetase (AMP-forming)/AMP-acid ligase II